MKQLFIGILIGGLLNGIYVQYRITGTVLGRPTCTAITNN